MDKATKRLLKQGYIVEIHCACLIHDTKYDWSYVDKLYRSLCRNLTPKVIFHVFTENNRPVPEPYIRHDLIEWPDIRGPKKSWWYKIQMFDPNHHSGQLLYFDLDTLIIDNIDWIWRLSSDYFWAVQDFKYLFRNRRNTLNSSVMWFNTNKYAYVLQDFDADKVRKNILRYHGDQDYIHEKIPSEKLRYFDPTRVLSYKWQVKEGGYNFSTRKYFKPGEISWPPPDSDILVFHGNPNPHEEDHPVIRDNWY
jgi:hypothetical protein